MLVLAEPLDPAFPGLGPLSDPARVGEALRSCAGELGGPPGAGAIRTIRYRPGQRHVLEYRRAGTAPLFIKLYRPGEGGPVAGAVTALAGLLEAAAVPRLHAVRPAAVLGDGDALVYRLAPGTPLSRALGAGLAPDATHLAHVGLLLRTIHAAPAPGVPLPERDLGGEVRTVTRACEAMAALRPDLGALAAGIVDRAHRGLVALEQEPPTPVHGDMKADHLLWGPQGLHVLDTDRCSLADPAYDLGKMLADLRFWGVTGAGTDAAGAETAVLSAYATTGARLDRARLYAALLLVRMAARRVPLASPDWAAGTAALLASAGRAVDAEGIR
jgi:aminoglycoside phosphotransferase (APT) family kinase protein